MLMASIVVMASRTYSVKVISAWHSGNQKDRIERALQVLLGLGTPGTAEGYWEPKGTTTSVAVGANLGRARSF